MWDSKLSGRIEIVVGGNKIVPGVIEISIAAKIQSIISSQLVPQDESARNSPPSSKVLSANKA